MATTASTTTATTLSSTTVADAAKARATSYTDFVSADVSKATNGLKSQLEEGAKNRLKLS